MTVATIVMIFSVVTIANQGFDGHQKEVTVLVMAQECCWVLVCVERPDVLTRSVCNTKALNEVFVSIHYVPRIPGHLRTTPGNAPR